MIGVNIGSRRDGVLPVWRNQGLFFGDLKAHGQDAGGVLHGQKSRDIEVVMRNVVAA